MPTYLSPTLLFITPTPQIRALDDKSIVITVPSGGQTPAKLRVTNADPDGPHAGRCSVAVWQTSVGELEWVDVGSGRPPSAGQIHEWERYLTPEALNLIQPNEQEPSYGELLLALPMEEG